MNTTDKTQSITALESAADFLEKTIFERKALLKGLIHENSLGMISGDTGGGKTWLTMHLAYAISAGKECKPWGAGTGVPVIYLDGESDEVDFQKRLHQIRNRDTNPLSLELGISNLHIFGRTWNEEIEDLDTVEGQKYIESLIEIKKPKLLIIDNLDSFCPTALNNYNRYKLFISWVTLLMQRGIAVLLIHHNNKAGQQHGSSVKVRRLHYALSLKKSKEKGSEFESHFLLSLTKCRNRSTMLEDDTRFVIRTRTNADGKVFTAILQEHLFSAKEELEDEICKLLDEGMAGKDIAEKLEISESKVSRIKNKR